MLECRMRLEAVDRAVLHFDPFEPPVAGAMALAAELVDEIDTARDLREAGAKLFDALFPEGEPTLEAYRETSKRARHEHRRLCLCLTFADDLPPWVDDLPWELLHDPRWHLALGCSHSAAVERRFEAPAEAPFASLLPVRGRLRLLMAVASPDDQLHHNLPDLDRTWEEWTLGSALQRLEGLIDWHVLEGPATADRVRRELASGAYHALHLVVHGKQPPHEKRANLLLEDGDGHGVWTGLPELAAIFADDPALHLLTMVACHDGIEIRADPFRGLGPALVRRGVPAVVVTRRALSMEVARSFTGHLYRTFALEGRLDAALAETRATLAEGPEGHIAAWAPALFVGRGAGEIWSVGSALRASLEDDTQAIEVAQQRVERQRRERLQALVEPPPPPKPAPRRPMAGWLALLGVGLLGIGLALGFLFDFDGRLVWHGLPRTLAADERSKSPTPFDPAATRRALPRYEEACDSGDARSCARVAAIFEHGRAGERDLTRACERYAMACELGDSSACYHWGQLFELDDALCTYALGSGVADVAVLYRRACEGGDHRGCRRLTLLVADLSAEAKAATGSTNTLAAGSDLGIGRALDDRQASTAGLGLASDGGVGAIPSSTKEDSREVQGPTAASDSSATAPDSSPDSASDTASADDGPGSPNKPPRRILPSVVVVDGGLLSPSEIDRGIVEAAAISITEGELRVTEVAGRGFEGRDSLSARGNIYRIDKQSELLEVSVWLDFEDTQELTFSILEAIDPLGRFVTAHVSAAEVEGSGPGWYSSEIPRLTLVKGRYYLVALAWDGEAAYSYGLSRDLIGDAVAQQTPFGPVLHGHTDLAPLLPEVESEVFDRAIYRQRLITRSLESEEGPLPEEDSRPEEP